MQIVSIFLMAVGLAMDAFAVSVCKGLSSKRIDWPRVFATALSFGAFQALMPTLGWLLGESVRFLIEPVDHWIAFALLAIIGAKMIFDAVRDDDCCDDDAADAGRRGFLLELLVLSVATSIDALAAGISFAMAGLPIFETVVTIGVVTFIMSLAGFAIGNRFGASFSKVASISGGAILIMLGLKILLEGLGCL